MFHRTCDSPAWAGQHTEVWHMNRRTDAWRDKQQRRDLYVSACLCKRHKKTKQLSNINIFVLYMFLNLVNVIPSFFTDMNLFSLKYSHVLYRIETDSRLCSRLTFLLWWGGWLPWSAVWWPTCNSLVFRVTPGNE